MTYLKSLPIFFFLLFFSLGCTLTVEETKYSLVKKSNHFEIRDYPTYTVAETSVDGTLEEAGNKAFRKLFNYISGENQIRGKIAMTAPVNQKNISKKIDMTTPVSQKKADEGWIVSFTMPASYTLESLPLPTDKDVRLHQIPAQRVASVRYSGEWSEELYRENLRMLETWIKESRFTVLGEPVWARYNPPITPWFLKRNEILIPIAKKEI